MKPAKDPRWDPLPELTIPHGIDDLLLAPSPKKPKP